jgi:hypothetical protein
MKSITYFKSSYYGLKVYNGMKLKKGTTIIYDAVKIVASA